MLALQLTNRRYGISRRPLRAMRSRLARRPRRGKPARSRRGDRALTVSRASPSVRPEAIASSAADKQTSVMTNRLCVGYLPFQATEDVINEPAARWSLCRV
jgi:hypothetical protein